MRWFEVLVPCNQTNRNILLIVLSRTQQEIIIHTLGIYSSQGFLLKFNIVNIFNLRCLLNYVIRQCDVWLPPHHVNDLIMSWFSYQTCLQTWVNWSYICYVCRPIYWSNLSRTMDKEKQESRRLRFSNQQLPYCFRPLYLSGICVQTGNGCSLLLFLENPLETRGIPPEHWLWSLKANLLLQSDSNNIQFSISTEHGINQDLKITLALFITE